MKKYSVLIVEDHPFTAEAYKTAFEKVSDQETSMRFVVGIVNDCDGAIQKIKEAVKGKTIDIFFLDISLPSSKKNKKIVSGEDLGIKIRKVLPKSKIVILTTHFDNYRINSIIKNIDPDGFFVKNDITNDSLIEGIKKVITTPPYFSLTVMQSLRKQFTNDYNLDKIDRQLLYELSQGTKMIELPKILLMSIAGVEKRKRRLKQLFRIRKEHDRELIRIAKEKGFI